MLPGDANLQMTVLFLLALALLGFAMKLASLFVPAAPCSDRPFMCWILPSPTSLARSQPVADVQRPILRLLLLSGAVLSTYWIYWQVVGAFHIRGICLSYLAVPILLLAGEVLEAVVTVLFLPSGRLFPALHHSPWAPQSVADFWGRRWNLWFSDWFRYVIFSPLRRRPVLALILVFAISGLMHEWVINIPLFYVTGRALFGTMMLYFLFQAFGVLLERRLFKKQSRLTMLFAYLVVVVPSPLVLNEGLLRALQLWPD